ncbi:UbiA family prenyltransferase [Desertivirga xinjiangensis]|uniref:UbiA family prenyltransferase n=1 Tax=Desertivirga xinjiangensis TaxID=539206 RepID=UPI00210EDBFC|nr:UbiA family prenyltransferase [Pedobacter xinjiangensis]
MRFFFSFFLLPVYLFALSQAPTMVVTNAVLVFIIWHFFIYPASNGYNSYFDKDEGSIALLEKPPMTDKSLYQYSLGLDLIGVLLSFIVSVEFAIATLLYGILSKMYSHPSIRLKKYPVISFLVVFIFQGAFVYWLSYTAISGISILKVWNLSFFIAGLVCSCLIGASYPLTQVYQHKEDKKRGDITLSVILGIKGSFAFAALLFLLASVLIYWYWQLEHQIRNFWLFLLFIIPVLVIFLKWLLEVLKNEKNANFKNMSRMTLSSGTAMLIYFLIVLLLG